MTETRHQPVHIIGAGLAGSEAAWQLVQAGVPVVLHEMRPVRRTEAHQTADCAELVCSNSFRSDDAVNNAVGLLHEEMRRAGSLILSSADAHSLPAGGALAVDRDGFARAVTEQLAGHPLVEMQRGEVAGLPPEEWDNVIVATGPLTSPALAEAVRGLTGESALSFFDAIAPIVHRETHRHGQGLAAVALRRRLGGRRLHQLRAGEARVSGLHRRLAGRRKDRLQGVGDRHAVFRGLPADRSDGGARPGTPCASAR